MATTECAVTQWSKEGLNRTQILAEGNKLYLYIDSITTGNKIYLHTDSMTAA